MQSLCLTAKTVCCFLWKEAKQPICQKCIHAEAGKSASHTTGGSQWLATWPKI